MAKKQPKTMKPPDDKLGRRDIRVIVQAIEFAQDHNVADFPRTTARQEEDADWLEDAKNKLLAATGLTVHYRRILRG